MTAERAARAVELTSAELGRGIVKLTGPQSVADPRPAPEPVHTAAHADRALVPAMARDWLLGKIDHVLRAHDIYDDDGAADIASDIADAVLTEAPLSDGPALDEQVRADLARAREEAQLRADVWRDRYARAEAETEAIAGDLAALREGLQATIDRANAEERRYAAEVERLHSWAGLMELLDEHWPADIWPMLEDDTKADAGHRVTSAMRWIDRLTAERDAARTDLAALQEAVQRLVDDGTGVECVPTDDLRALLGGQE